MDARVRGLLKVAAHLCPFRRVRGWARTAVFSHSLRTAHLLHTRRERDAEVSLPGYPGTFHFRSGTSDAYFIRLLANGYDLPEYRIPIPCRPRTIIDFGANIGVVSILFARTYPEAKIYSFEPQPELFELLAHNVSGFPNVTPVPFGVGARTEHRTYFYTRYHPNRTGSFYNDGMRSFGRLGPLGKAVQLQVVAVAEALQQYGIDAAEIIKIDTEGAEHEILSNLPDAFLDGVQVIVGEFHGTRNLDLRALLQARFHVTWRETHSVSADPNADGGIGVFTAVRPGAVGHHPIAAQAPAATTGDERIAAARHPTPALA